MPSPPHPQQSSEEVLEKFVETIWTKIRVVGDKIWLPDDTEIQLSTEIWPQMNVRNEIERSITTIFILDFRGGIFTPLFHEVKFFESAELCKVINVFQSTICAVSTGMLQCFLILIIQRRNGMCPDRRKWDLS